MVVEMTRAYEKYKKLNAPFLINSILEVLTEDEEEEILGEIDHIWWEMSHEEQDYEHEHMWVWNRVLIGQWSHIKPAGTKDEPDWVWK